MPIAFFAKVCLLTLKFGGMRSHVIGKNALAHQYCKIIIVVVFSPCYLQKLQILQQELRKPVTSPAHTMNKS